MERLTTELKDRSFHTLLRADGALISASAVPNLRAMKNQKTGVNDEETAKYKTVSTGGEGGEGGVGREGRGVTVLVQAFPASGGERSA